MSATIVQPYLIFGGRAEEAIVFYQTALGAKLDMMMRFNESPQPAPPGVVPPDFENKVMHASIRIGPDVVMLSDGCDADVKFTGFSLSLTLPSEAEVDRAFSALSAGGKISMPLSKTFWSARFGMVTDKFGVSWMLTVPIENHGKP